MAIGIKLRAGRFAVRKTLDVASAAYTRQMREQMRSIEGQIRSIIKDIESATPEALEAALRPTFELSQKYVPVDTGKLKRSGFLESVSGDRKIPRVVIGYGKRGRPPYAVFVHERTDLRHKSPTRSKFLQAAVEEDIDNIRRRLLSSLTLKAG